MRHRPFLLLSLFMLPAGVLSASDAEIIDKIFQRQQEITATVRDVTYIGESRSQELDAGGKIKKDNIAKRRIWMKGNREHSEYFYVKSDGKELSGEAIKKETAKWGGGRNQDSGMRDKMPFTAGTRNAYTYTVKGAENRNGMDVWVVRFDPVKKEIGYLTGKAFILDGSFDIVGLEFLPAKSFFVIKNMSFSLDYAKTSGFWFPSRFTMDLEVEIKAVVDLAHIIVKVREEYKDYRINTGFSDDVFRDSGKK